MPPRYTRTTSTTPAKPPSAAYPKGSPARKVVKTNSQSPTFLGITRSASTTTVNGVVTGQSSTVHSGGGGGGFLGLALIASGAFFLWIVFKGKSGAMWNAISGNSGFDVTLNDLANAVNPYINNKGGTTGGGGSGSKTSAPVSGNTTDSGTHMGIDPSGNIITINSDYGSMTNEQKDAANAYAHQIGNVG